MLEGVRGAAVRIWNFNALSWGLTAFIWLITGVFALLGLVTLYGMFAGRGSDVQTLVGVGTLLMLGVVYSIIRFFPDLIRVLISIEKNSRPPEPVSTPTRYRFLWIAHVFLRVVALSIPFALLCRFLLHPLLESLYYSSRDSWAVFSWAVPFTDTLGIVIAAAIAGQFAARRLNSSAVSKRAAGWLGGGVVVSIAAVSVVISVLAMRFVSEWPNRWLVSIAVLAIPMCGGFVLRGRLRAHAKAQRDTSSITSYVALGVAAVAAFVYLTRTGLGVPDEYFRYGNFEGIWLLVHGFGAVAALIFIWRAGGDSRLPEWGRWTIRGTAVVFFVGCFSLWFSLLFVVSGWLVTTVDPMSAQMSREYQSLMRQIPDAMRFPVLFVGAMLRMFILWMMADALRVLERIEVNFRLSGGDDGPVQVHRQFLSITKYAAWAGIGLLVWTLLRAQMGFTRGFDRWLNDLGFLKEPMEQWLTVMQNPFALLFIGVWWVIMIGLFADIVALAFDVARYTRGDTEVTASRFVALRTLIGLSYLIAGGIAIGVFLLFSGMGQTNTGKLIGLFLAVLAFFMLSFLAALAKQVLNIEGNLRALWPGTASTGQFWGVTFFVVVNKIVAFLGAFLIFGVTLFAALNQGDEALLLIPVAAIVAFVWYVVWAALPDLAQALLDIEGHVRFAREARQSREISPDPDLGPALARD
jgi:hypothetical protein